MGRMIGFGISIVMTLFPAIVLITTIIENKAFGPEIWLASGIIALMGISGIFITYFSIK